MLPQLATVELFILSVGSMIELAELEVSVRRTGVCLSLALYISLAFSSHAPCLHVFSQQGLHELVPNAGTPLHDQAWRELMAKLRTRWSIKRLAVCFKSRDETGLQRRWSGRCMLLCPVTWWQQMCFV